MAEGKETTPAVKHTIRFLTIFGDEKVAFLLNLLKIDQNNCFDVSVYRYPCLHFDFMKIYSKSLDNFDFLLRNVPKC